MKNDKKNLENNATHQFGNDNANHQFGNGQEMTLPQKIDFIKTKENMTKENKQNDYTFELNSDGNILCKGRMRVKSIGAGYRHYKAYEEYCKDTEVANRLKFLDFNAMLYLLDGKGLTEIGKKYGHLKLEDEQFINYLSLLDFDLTLEEEMDMGIISEEFKGMIIKEMKSSVKVNFESDHNKYWLDKDQMKEILIICKKNNLNSKNK